MVLEWLLPIYEEINNIFLSQSALLFLSGDGKYWEGRLSPFLRKSLVEEVTAGWARAW